MATLRTLIATGCAAALFAAPSALACSKPITLITEEWAPYAFNFGADIQTGLDIELARAILDEAGCTLVTAPFVPAVRRMLMFERGEIDLLLAASETPERHRFARFTTAYRNETVGLFVLAQNYARHQGVDGFGTLLEQELGLLAPTIGWYGKEYERARPRLKVSGLLSTFGTIQQGMRMLVAGRAPLIMGDAAAIQYEARNQDVQVRQLSYVVLLAPVHLMFSRASTTAEDVAQVNAAIARLERSGVLKNIRAMYGVR